MVVKHVAKPRLKETKFLLHKNKSNNEGIEVFSDASIRIYQYGQGFDLPMSFAIAVKHIQTEAINSIAEHFTVEQIQTWQAGKSEDFIDFIKNCHANYFVFDEREEIIGYAILPKAGFLQQFFIHPNYQFKGIGTKLLSVIEKEASNRDNKGMLSLNGNNGSYQFYLKLGYSIAKEHDLDMRGVLIPVKLMEKV
ncbi:GNAT family N-acetyltransferase [Seonamhaeicola sp. MEBiC1930]|uniref:GNAT family N-acetyltransferase n=1 Tax=Seonamhaeicola sp. MEBiC01930 TaxID=2976768 RepID=UPI0032537C72